MPGLSTDELLVSRSVWGLPENWGQTGPAQGSPCVLCMLLFPWNHLTWKCFQPGCFYSYAVVRGKFLDNCGRHTGWSLCKILITSITWVCLGLWKFQRQITTCWCILNPKHSPELQVHGSPQCGPRTSGVSTTWRLVRNTEAQTLAQTHPLF